MKQLPDDSVITLRGGYWEPTPEIRAVHEGVRLAQQAGVDAVQDIDQAARRVIADAGYGERFIHRTGHGIGVTMHEPPYLVEGEEQPLVPHSRKSPA